MGRPADAQDPDRAPVVVVGVDGSPPSLEALRWALTESGPSGGTVRAVFVLPWDEPAAGQPGNDAENAAEDLSLVQLAGDELIRAIRRALGEEVLAQVAPVVIPADSTPVGLARAAAHADLLVVGSGRHRDETGNIGENALAVLQGMPCPVVVVPSS